MSPHKAQPISINSLLISLWRNRQLCLQMTKRDVIGRYKGSVIGVLWSFLNPLFLLLVYSYVFSGIFKTRWWGAHTQGNSHYNVLLFIGMIIHSFFSETLSRAPSLILSNVSYVKKILFPLEILPVVAIGSALFHAFVSMFVLIFSLLLMNGYLQWTALFVPLLILPLLILTLGIAWGLASLGVFLRDVSQPISLIMTVFLFASPVIYPISEVPESIRPWLMLNPLTFIIEQTRSVLIFGKIPDWIGLANYSLVSVVIGWIGYVWFQKTRKGFADVL